MTTSYLLAIGRMYGPCAIRDAARHNLREIAAEMGADGHIDPARIRDNFILRGPDNSAEVVLLAKLLLDTAGVTKLRKTAVRGLELMFTLPAGTAIDTREYFERATCWAEKHFAVPVLSSIVHLDESAPHCHVLLLPLVNGRMNGSDLHGNKAKLWAMQASFHEDVSVKYGFTRQAPKKRLSAVARAAIMARLRECFQNCTALSDQAISVLLKPHAKDPELLLLALGIEMPSTQSTVKNFVAIMTAPCKPEPRRYGKGKTNVTPESYVEIEQQLGSYPYTCVGKGISTDVGSADSQHRQGVPAKYTSSMQLEPITYAANSNLSIKSNSECHSMTAVPDEDHGLVATCGELAQQKALGTDLSRTRASDLLVSIGRIGVPVNSISLALYRNVRSERHAICSRRTRALGKAGSAYKINGKPFAPALTFARRGVPRRYRTLCDDGADGPPTHWRDLTLGLQRSEPRRLAS